MKKIAFLIIIMSFLPSMSIAQGVLHIVYLRQDNSVNATKMVDKVKEYVQQHRNDNFVIYYSDVKPLVMLKRDYAESELVGTITSQSSSIAMHPLREINNVSEILEENSFSKVAIACFVGTQFFEDRYQNSFVARLLLVNKLNDEAKATLTYISCGESLNTVNTEFYERYSIAVKPNIQ